LDPEAAGGGDEEEEELHELVSPDLPVAAVDKELVLSAKTPAEIKERQEQRRRTHIRAKRKRYIRLNTEYG
jgi:hypothetical protein